MAQVIMLLAVLLPMLLAAAFLLGRHFQRPRARGQELSPVTRQHLHLFQGGQLSESAVESAKRQLEALLERGQVEAVEKSLRPGTDFVVRVRALAEIGTEDAGRILERQLQRRLSDDQIEQSWYWIDLANGLRSLNRDQSLPHLLRCAEAAGDIPLGHFFAAETVCFVGFRGYLSEPDSLLGRAALRVLHRALEGLRCGVPASLFAEARLGEAVETLWDHRPEEVHPLAARVFREALRALRRSSHAELTLSEERADLEVFQWQMSRLAALEPSLEDYLKEAPAPLVRRLTQAPVAEHRDLLLALADLRAEAASAVLPLLVKDGYPHAEPAVELLTYSKDPAVGAKLREWAAPRVTLVRRVQRRGWGKKPPAHSPVPHQAVLRAFRGHASPETEAVLVMAALDWVPAYRLAAIGSLGWWEPYHRGAVLRCLLGARRDPSAEVRQAAQAALARLGQRTALHWFRQALTREEAHKVHEAIGVIASEGLFFLWPDLDTLADSPDADVARHAREALERFCEDMGPR